MAACYGAGPSATSPRPGVRACVMGTSWSSSGQLVDELVVTDHRDQPGRRIGQRERPVVEAGAAAKPDARCGRRPVPGRPRSAAAAIASAGSHGGAGSRSPNGAADEAAHAVLTPRTVAGDCLPSSRATGSRTRTPAPTRASSMSSEPGSDPTGTYAHTVVAWIAPRTGGGRAAPSASAARCSGGTARRAAQDVRRATSPSSSDRHPRRQPMSPEPECRALRRLIRR